MVGVKAQNTTLCIHSILDFGVVKSKLNLHLYITGSFYTVVFLYRIFFLVS